MTINLVDVVEVDVSTLTLWEGLITLLKKMEATLSLKVKTKSPVCLAYQGMWALFNAVSESAANNSSSPAGTEWAREL